MNKYFLILLILFSITTAVAQWELRFPKQYVNGITDIAFLDNLKGFAVSGNGNILKTTDGGNSWQIKAHYHKQHLSKIIFTDDQTGFIFSPETHFADNIDIVVTQDGGENWSPGFIGVYRAKSFYAISDSVLLHGSDWGQIMRTQNSISNWIETYMIPWDYTGWEPGPYGTIKDFQKLKSNRILALGTSEYAYIAGTIQDSVSFILASDDTAYTWDTLWCGLPKLLKTMHFSDAEHGWLGGDDNEIYKTTNGGVSWQRVYTDSGNVIESTICRIAALSPSKVFAVTSYGNLLSSTNGGTDWNVNPVSYSPYGSWYNVYFLSDEVGFISGGNLLMTTDGGNTWNKVDTSSVPRFHKLQFLNMNDGFAAAGSSLYKTSDGGYNWNKLSEFSSCNFFMRDLLNGWVVDNNRLKKTTDGGNTWNEFYVDSAIAYIRGVEFFDENFGVLFDVSKFPNTNVLKNYVTTNGGNTWTGYNISNDFVTSFFKIRRTDPAHMWFVNQQGVWLSRDSSKTWTLFSEATNTSTAFDFLDSLNGWTTKLDAFQNKVDYTTDGGYTWNTLNKPYMVQTHDLVIEGRDESGRICATLAGIDGSIFRFTEGFTYPVEEMSFTNSPLLALSVYREGNTIHKWLGGEVLLYRSNYILDVPEENFAPSEFRLFQNYPNPFNPHTRIEYSIPSEAFTTIKLFDILGKEIMTLVSEEKSTGTYEYFFDAGNLPSGIYFYQLRTGTYTETKKMILLR